MGSINFTISYAVNSGDVLSSSELISLYMYGLPLCTSDGRSLSYDTIQKQIKIAQTKIENILQLKINKEIYDESVDFERTEFSDWGFLKANYQINQPISLNGFLGDQKQLSYPLAWMVTRKTNDTFGLTRNLYLVANGGKGADISQTAVVYTGLSPMIGWLGFTRIPDYWRFSYVTGYDKVPMDILDAIGKLASIAILAQLGDITLGIGFSSQSISLDGLSQSLSLIKSAQGGIYAGRITLFTQQLIDEIQTLKYNYKGIGFNVI